MNVSNLSGLVGVGDALHPVSKCADPESVVEWCNEALASELVHIKGYVMNMEIAFVVFCIAFVLIYFLVLRGCRGGKGGKEEAGKFLGGGDEGS